MFFLNISLIYCVFSTGSVYLFMFLLIINRTESENYKQEKSKQEKSHIKEFVIIQLRNMTM